MHNKMAIASGVLLGVLISATPIAQNISSPMSLTVYAAETTESVPSADITYDSETSLLIIKPKSGGTTYFSYKINDQYPTYSKDKVCFFNADGSLREEMTGMLGQAIFSDDASNWIDVTKTTPKVSHESEYYNRMRAGDCEVVLPYSEVNNTNEFYIPVTEVGTKVTVNVVSIADDGTLSEVQSIDFQFLGVAQDTASKINAKVSSVSKSSNSETVRISGDNVKYVQVGSEIHNAKNNSVDIELTSNGEKSFLVFGADTATPEVLTYTVEGLKASVDEEIADEKVDSTAPTITTDTIPTDEQDTAIKFKVYTDEPCTISCNGESADGTELELTIAGNGEYLVTATDKAGNYSEKTITFNCFSDFVGEYELDKDNLWGTNSVSTNKLPQTGGIGFISLLGIGGGCIGGGLFALKKGKKKKDE